MVKGKTAKLAWFCYIRWIEQLKFISWDIVANTIVVWNGTYRSIMETESKNWQKFHKLSHNWQKCEMKLQKTICLSGDYDISNKQMDQFHG